MFELRCDGGVGKGSAFWGLGEGEGLMRLSAVSLSLLELWPLAITADRNANVPAKLRLEA